MSHSQTDELAAAGLLAGLIFLTGYDVTAVDTVVDVGGGSGELVGSTVAVVVVGLVLDNPLGRWVAVCPTREDDPSARTALPGRGHRRAAHWSRCGRAGT